MNASNLPGFDDIRPADLERYLTHSGWSSRPSKRSGVVYYEYTRGAPSSGTVATTVLTDTTYADYARRTAEAVELIASVEGRSAADVLSDLLTPPGDVVRFRYISDNARAGSLPFDDGIRARIAQRTMVLASAHSALDARAHFPRLSMTQPASLLSECMDGQTERGSYVTTLIVPVAPEVGKLPIEEPYGRRVTTVLMTALGEICDAIGESKHETLLRLAKAGVSANLLGALADMKPTGRHASVEITMRWSKLRPPPRGIRTCVRFDEKAFSVAQEAGRVLRETSSAEGVDLDGYVIKLRRQKNSTDAPGVIVINSRLDGQKGDVGVRVELAPDDYQRALNAHRAARKVKVTGTLVKRGKAWTLLDASDLREVLPTADSTAPPSLFDD